MNENTLYYAFSTVAQVLASAFGIMAAVVLFRISGADWSSEVARTFGRWFKLTFFLTSGTIAICVVAIPFVPRWFHNNA
jgi:hypothetical protein